MWRSYDRIYEILDLTHQVVNHSIGFINPEAGVHTNYIKGTWNGIKLRIPVRNRIQNRISEHFFEFIWKRTHQNNLWNAFLNALKDVSYD